MAKKTVWCAFCDSEAEKVIKHKDSQTPVCSHCADIYKAGQASPDAEMEDL